MKLDFDKIRQQLRAVVQEHGGKIEIKEWDTNDGDQCLKVEMTFKNLHIIAMSPRGPVFNTTELSSAVK